MNQWRTGAVYTMRDTEEDWFYNIDKFTLNDDIVFQCYV